MTIGELLAKLSGLDPEIEVVLASDAEGNDFYRLDDIGYGWFRSSDGDRDYFDDDDDEYEPQQGDSQAVCLWP